MDPSSTYYLSVCAVGAGTNPAPPGVTFTMVQRRGFQQSWMTHRSQWLKVGLPAELGDPPITIVYKSNMTYKTY